MKRPAASSAAAAKQRRVRRSLKRPRSLGHLERWLSQSGVTWSEELSFAASTAHGVGVFARAALRRGRTVARIPVSICLGIQTCSIAKKLKQLLKNGTLDEELALVLAVLSERRLGQQSKWDGYFRHCLRHDVPHTPQVWTRKEQQLLRGTECDRCDEAKWHDQAQRHRQAENKALLSRMQPLMKSLFAKGKPVTWKEYKEASYWCESRAFNLGNEEQGEVLCPLADLFNHRSAPRTPGSGHSFGGDIAVCSGSREDCVTIVTQGQVERGEEVFNCYGAHGNAKLLADYGFCCQPNPHTRVVLRPRAILAVAAQRYTIPEQQLREKLCEVLAAWGDDPMDNVVRREVQRRACRRRRRGGSSDDSSSEGEEEDDEEEGLEAFAIRKSATATATATATSGRSAASTSTSTSRSRARGGRGKTNVGSVKAPKGLQKLASAIVGLCRSGSMPPAARRLAADRAHEISRLLEAVARARQRELLTSGSGSAAKSARSRPSSGSGARSSASSSSSSSPFSASASASSAAAAAAPPSSSSAALSTHRRALAETLRKEELGILRAFLANLRERRRRAQSPKTRTTKKKATTTSKSAKSTKGNSKNSSYSRDGRPDAHEALQVLEVK